MTDYPEYAVVHPEWLCEALDEALGEPCSYEMAGRILSAVSPLIDKHREAAYRAGIEAAAKAFKSAQYSPAPYTDGMLAIQRLATDTRTRAPSQSGTASPTVDVTDR